MTVIMEREALVQVFPTGGLAAWPPYKEGRSKDEGGQSLLPHSLDSIEPRNEPQSG